MNNKDHVVQTPLGYVQKWKRGGFNGEWYFTADISRAKRYTEEDAQKVVVNVVFRGPASAPTSKIKLAV